MIRESEKYIDYQQFKKMFDNYGSHYKILRVMELSNEKEKRHKEDV